MKVWIISSLHDDSDPGDHAELSTLKAFVTLDAAREWFRAQQAKFGHDQRGWLEIDVDDEGLDELFESDAPEGVDLRLWANEQAMKNPECFTWTNGWDYDEENGYRSWNGGVILEFNEVEVG